MFAWDKLTHWSGPEDGALPWAPHQAYHPP